MTDLIAVEAPAALVFPVGHYLGPYHTAGGDPALAHRLRVGGRVRPLESAELLHAWVLAHGVAGQLTEEPWTYRSALEYAGLFGSAASAAAFDQLRARRLVVEVVPGTVEAVAFATAHRLRPLQLPLGRDPDQPGLALVGCPGQPAVALPPSTYDMWLSVQRTPSLWTACRSIAQDRPDGAAEAVLDEVLGHLHGLLSIGAGYLDTVLEGAL